VTTIVNSSFSMGDRPTIVLSMIVKNEAHVIERCLTSIKPVIDSWCIVDTGSTDGTQELIRQFMHDLPGEVIEQPWINFAHNRTEALESAAKWGDFALVIDADVGCILPPAFQRDEFAATLDADYYQVMIRDGIHYQRNMLTSTKLPFLYRGALHEFLVVPEGARDGGIVKSFHYESKFDGARSQNTMKSIDDAATLVAALDGGDDPDLETRYLFYLANSLRDGGELETATEVYRARIALGGWAEELYVSYLNLGRLLHAMGEPDTEVINTFLRAHDLLPTRAEALCSGAAVARSAGRMATAHVLSRQAKDIPRPVDSLFLEPDVYVWRALYEFSIAAWHVGDFGEGIRASHRLLFEDKLPSAERESVEGNVNLYPAEAITW
jgi:glycosyltransferase involved in cell wall biosynthesis